MPFSDLPVIGFLGAGAIVNAMVTGFCERAAGTPYPIIVSDMRPEACKALHDRYPDRVKAASICRLWSFFTGKRLSSSGMRH